MINKVFPLKVFRKQFYNILCIYISVVAFIICVSCEHSVSDIKDWELIREVDNPYGGSNIFVLISEDKIRDLRNYSAIGDAICSNRKQCSLMFWIDAKQIPKSSDIPVPNLWEMTAMYEVHPNFDGVHLRLACWLYQNKEVGEAAKCFYMPGKKYWTEE